MLPIRGQISRSAAPETNLCSDRKGIASTRRRRSRVPMPPAQASKVSCACSLASRTFQTQNPPPKTQNLCLLLHESKEFSLLNKVLFSLLGGLFLVVLIPQNLVYLGVPVRISGWLLLGATLVQVWFCRHKLVAWTRAFYSNTEIRTLAVVILLTITFNGIVPSRQGLEWY
jgi:hypothetical protein